MKSFVVERKIIQKKAKKRRKDKLNAEKKIKKMKRKESLKKN